jgi:uncharacterized iron-regulated membrane protein
MSPELSSGLPYLVMDVGAVLVLALAAIYGTYMWRKRRQRRPPGPLKPPGPASKEDEQRTA